MSKKTTIIASVIGATVLIGGGLFINHRHQASENTLKIGINTGELPFYKFIQKQLEKENINLDIKTFDDYVQPNLALGNDNLDINAFQHIPYLEEFQKSHKSDKGVQDIKTLTKTIVSPLRLYSKSVKNIGSLKALKNIKIAVPNDPTNEARALHLLESQGLIKLTKSDLTATKKDVKEVEGIKVDIKELDAAQTAKVISEVDASVINGNFAQESKIGLDLAIGVESENVYHKFDNIVAGKEKIKSTNKYKKFEKAIKSENAEKKRKELNKYDLFVK